MGKGMSEKEDPEALVEESEEQREQRLEREKQDLLTRVASSELSTIAHRVAWLLNHIPTLGIPISPFRLSTGKRSRRK